MEINEDVSNKAVEDCEIFVAHRETMGNQNQDIQAVENGDMKLRCGFMPLSSTTRTTFAIVPTIGIVGYKYSAVFNG